MIIDTLTQFGQAKPLNTGAAGSYTLGDVIDLGKNGLNIGTERSLWLVVQVNTTATSGGSATLQISLCSDSTSTIAVDGSQTIHYTGPAVAVATLVAGYRYCCIRVPSGTYERYLGIVQTTGTAAFTAGKLFMALVEQPSNWTAYDDAL